MTTQFKTCSLVCGIGIAASGIGHALTSPEEWVETQKMTYGIPDVYPEFGDSVAIDGTLVAVGSPADTRAPGAVDLYDAATGTLLRTIFAPEPQILMRFGQSVALSGERLLVGSPYASRPDFETGEAYVFDALTGTFLDTLPFGEYTFDKRFGHDVALEGDIAVVSAPQGLNQFGDRPGAVHVYDLTTRTQLSLISIDDPTLGYTGFGTSIDFDGALVIAGSPSDNWSGNFTGAAYVHRAATGEMVSMLRLESSQREDNFGFDVAITGRFAAVSAYEEGGHGAVHIFDALSGELLRTLLPDDLTNRSHFGNAISASRDRIMIGARHDNTRGSLSGAAFIFDLHSGELISSLSGSDTDWDDRFAESVAINETRAVAGAPNAQSPANERGSAYIFDRIPARPTLQQEGRCGGTVSIIIENLTPGGQAAIFAGTTLAPYELPGPACPGVIIDIAEPWLRGTPVLVDADAQGRAELTSSVPSSLCDRLNVQALNLDTCGLSEPLEISAAPWRVETSFGLTDQERAYDPRALATDGISTLAPGTISINGGPDLDAVHVFDATTTEYGLTLIADVNQTDSRFGQALALEADIAVVGAFMDDDLAPDAGAVYTFDLTTGDQIFKLTAPDGNAGDFFGTAVAVEDGMLAVGAPEYPTPPIPPAPSGAVYLIDLATGEPLRTLLHPRLQKRARFGATLALDGGLVVAGAPWDGLRMSLSGAAYVFDAHSGELMHTLIGTDTVATDRFASSLDADQGIAVVGAPTADRVESRREEGRAYLFDLATGAELFVLQPWRPRDYEYFGTDVAISGRTAVVASPGTDTASFRNVGTIYLYDVSTGALLTRLTPSTCIDDSGFAEALAIHDDMIFGTSLRTDDPLVGSVYLIREVPLIP